MPQPHYTEETFKGCPWTMFFETTSGSKRLTPYNHILIQAPRGVAEDVLRNGFDVDPHGTNRDGDDYSVTEDMKDISWLFNLASNNSIFICRYDSVPYYSRGFWKVPKWTPKKED